MPYDPTTLQPYTAPGGQTFYAPGGLFDTGPALTPEVPSALGSPLPAMGAQQPAPETAPTGYQDPVALAQEMTRKVQERGMAASAPPPGAPPRDEGAVLRKGMPPKQKAPKAAQSAATAQPDAFQQADQAVEQAFVSQAQAGQEAADIGSQVAAEQYGAQQAAYDEAQGIDQERQRVAAEREKQRKAKEQQIEQYVSAEDNFKIDENKFWNDASTAKNIGRVIAMAMTGIGMALQGRGHEQNPVIAMFDQAAQRSVRMQMDQRDQLARKTARAEKALDAFDRISDSTDARFAADMARAYERGIRQGDLAAQKYGSEQVQANWKAQRAEMEKGLAFYKGEAADKAFGRYVQSEQIANAKKQTAIAGGHLKLSRDQFERGKLESDRDFWLKQQGLELEAGKLAQSGQAAQAKMVAEQGIGGVPILTKNENGAPAVQYGVLKNADDTVFVAPTVDEAKLLRTEKASVDLVNDWVNGMVREIQESGGESEYIKSDSYQRRISDLGFIKETIRKGGGMGALDKGTDAAIDKMLGGADPNAYIRDAVSGLKKGSANLNKQFNAHLRAAQYTGPEYTPPDTSKLGASRDQAGEDFKKSLGWQTNQYGYGKTPDVIRSYSPNASDQQITDDSRGYTDNFAEVVNDLAGKARGGGAVGEAAKTQLRIYASRSDSPGQRQLATEALKLAESGRILSEPPTDAYGTPLPTPKGKFQ